jgi:hypothetical protein
MHSELIPTGRQKVVAGKRNGVLEYGCIGLIQHHITKLLRQNQNANCSVGEFSSIAPLTPSPAGALSDRAEAKC